MGQLAFRSGIPDRDRGEPAHQSGGTARCQQLRGEAVRS